MVQQNLALVFPEKNKEERHSIEKAFYRHMCDMFLEMIKTMSLTKPQINKKFTTTNLEVLQNLVKERTVLVLCAHYANWEWNVSINNHINSKGYAVYQKLANTYFDNFIKKVRSKWNTTLITQSQTVKTVVRNKQEGKKVVIGMVSDQSPQAHRAQYWSDFMGINVPVFNGAEIMARKMDLAVVFLKVSQTKRGYYQAELITITENGKETAETEITERFLQLAEQQIRERPELYLWTHNRWKHRDKRPAAFAKVNT